jgi:hypothetical protein
MNEAPQNEPQRIELPAMFEQTAGQPRASGKRDHAAEWSRVRDLPLNPPQQATNRHAARVARASRASLRMAGAGSWPFAAPRRCCSDPTYLRQRCEEA